MTEQRLVLERQIVASILNNPAEFRVFMGVLKPSYFADEFHREVVSHAIDCVMSGSEPDVVTMAGLTGEPVRIIEISGAASGAGSISLLSKRLAEHVIDDRVHDFREAAERDALESVNQVRMLHAELGDILTAHDQTPKTRVVEDYLRYVRENAAGAVRSVSCGFPSFDRWGVLRNANMSFIGGTPGAGKTSFLLAVALGAAMRGYKVRYLQGEMPSEEVMERLQGIWSGKPYEDIANGLYPRETDEFADLILGLPLEFDLIYNRTMHGIMSAVHRAMTSKAQLVIVDYLQVFVPKGKPQEEFGNIKLLSETIRREALLNSCHFLVASSLNRIEAGATKMTVNSFYGGSQMGHDANAAMILYPYEDAATAESVTVKLDVVKNRRGRKGEIAMHFDLKSQRMTEQVTGPMVEWRSAPEDEQPF
jgi:replicative DNA helicase